MEEFDKPYKNYDELIEILVHRGLKIENEEYAKFLLQTVGYYPLINGFKKPFLIEDNPEKFEPGTTLEDLYNLYIIDSQFQELFLTNVLYIEKHLASLLGNLIGKYYGVNNFNETDENNPNPEVRSYLDAHNYRGTKRYSVLREVKRQMEICKNNPIKYYRENKNHIPPWILTQNLYFGTNIQLYSIQKSNIKTAIVQKMVPIKENENLDAKKGLFGCLAEILRQFRNTAAHFSPMYLKKVSQRNTPSKRFLSFYLGNQIWGDNDPSGLGENDLYSALLAIFLLMRDPAKRRVLLIKLSALDDSYDQDDNYRRSYRKYLDAASLPVDYIDRLKSVEINIENLGNSALTLQSQKVGLLKTVYHVKGSNTYHKDKNCRYIRNNSSSISEISEQVALDRGYRACKICE